MTRLPVAFFTGFDSPVINASSTSDSPETTSPSAGTLAPGRTSTTSPTASIATGTVAVAPSSSSCSAVSGISLASSWSAPEAWRTLRISSQWPSSMTSISSAISQKKSLVGSIQTMARL